MRVVRFGRIPKVPVTEVYVPLELNAGEAKAIVSMVYAALPDLTDADRCTKDPYAHRFARDVPLSFEDPDEGDPELTINKYDKLPYLSLERNSSLISLRPDPDHPGAMRIRCWDELRYYESLF